MPREHCNIIQCVEGATPDARTIRCDPQAQSSETFIRQGAMEACQMPQGRRGRRGDVVVLVIQKRDGEALDVRWIVVTQREVMSDPAAAAKSAAASDDSNSSGLEGGGSS